MARSRDTGAAAKRKEQSTMQRKRKAGQKKHDHRQEVDPWALPVPTSSTQAASGKEKTTTTSTTTTSTSEEAGSDDKDATADDIALPIPISATVPCKIVAADGREAVIYTPIDGFEHLFKPGDGSQDIPCSPRVPAPGPSVRATHERSQPPGSHGNNTSSDIIGPGRPPNGAHVPLQHSIQKQRARRSVSPDASRAAAPRPAVERPKALKRSRSTAQGLSTPPQATQAIGSRKDAASDDDEPVVVNLRTRTFRMGDMEELKLFLRYRLDELTMKPLRPIVTVWIKQLEPRRLGEYGPYHKVLPADAPSDATPPWWPEDVIYNEPSHLPKSGLLSLAVDIMLQHRSKDEIKRRSPWVAKLRQTAEYAIDMTPPETFSSSDDPNFSLMMQDRARNTVLPSLFSVAQSYEDYVFQHELWEIDEGSRFPSGKSITWQPIERPPRRPAPRKRPRKVKREPDVDTLVEPSGDETEVDDTMEIITSRRMSRRQPSFSQKWTGPEARRTYIEDDVPPTPQDEIEIEESKPMIRVASRQGFTPSSSFDQNLTRLHLSEDSNGGSTFQSPDQPQKLGMPTSSLDSTTGYAGNSGSSTYSTIPSNHSFSPVHGTSTFNHPGTPALMSYEAQSYMNPMSFTLYNGVYHMQPSDGSFGSSMSLNANTFPYGGDATMANTSMDMSSIIPQANGPPFNGVPYGYGFHDPCQPQPQQQQPFCHAPTSRSHA